MTDADRAREVLADAYERAGYPDEASAFRSGEWTCHDHPALAAMRTAIAQAHAAGRAEGLTIAADIARKSVESCRAQGSMSADREFVGAVQEAADIEAAIIRARITTTGERP